MKLFRFGPEIARPVNEHNSSFRIVPLIMADVGEVRVHCMYLRPHDWVGYHKAGLPQLFCVVQGEGWVQGSNTSDKTHVTSGQAAFWVPGEEHAAGTNTGMMVIVIQAEQLDPVTFLEAFDPLGDADV